MARAARSELRLPDIQDAPNFITAYVENGAFPLSGNNGHWSSQQVALRIDRSVLNGRSVTGIYLRSLHQAMSQIRLRWTGMVSLGQVLFLGDQWERSYGDLSWRSMDPERVMPWYLLASNGHTTAAVGVQTGANALCYWQVDGSGLDLVLDVRSGGRGVLLGDRELKVATLISAEFTGQSPFLAAHQFCKLMCPAPRLPKQPVYGGNNWYYAYGKSSASDIRGDSARVASWSSSETNRPFMVIDDGWQPNPTAGPWDRGNDRFSDMQRLAEEMRHLGVRPGIWVRPLFTREAIPEGWKLRSPGAGKSGAEDNGWTLDPTIPEALNKVREDVRRVSQWGFELIKHDFSTFDLLGRWGSTMGSEITASDWTFADRSRTNAEIIRNLYTTIRDAAPDRLLLGCNTVGHLSAGIFELQRIGDDTSGREWVRTRKMGVNTLAFRAPQHDAFFAVDADCVGVTRDVSWAENRQWLNLLARSGTPLFVSAAPDAVGPEQRRAFEQAFQTAATPQPLGEPLDWMDTTEPAEWQLGGRRIHFDWFLSR